MALDDVLDEPSTVILRNSDEAEATLTSVVTSWTDFFSSTSASVVQVMPSVDTAKMHLSWLLAARSASMLTSKSTNNTPEVTGTEV